MVLVTRKVKLRVQLAGDSRMESSGKTRVWRSDIRCPRFDYKPCFGMLAIRSK
jgi:hypothetical protein